MDNLKIPLGLLAAIVSALAYSWDHVNTHFVTKSEHISLVGSVERLRFIQLEDKIFSLELIPLKKQTNYDRASLEKYKMQLEELLSDE
tara:strand:+ start:39 stop:302 length:264 start_codon:yes stop_codon:yes gene_type:complete